MALKQYQDVDEIVNETATSTTRQYQATSTIRNEPTTGGGGGGSTAKLVRQFQAVNRASTY